MPVLTPQGWLEKLLTALRRQALQAPIKPVFSPRFSIRVQRRCLTGWAGVAVGAGAALISRFFVCSTGPRNQPRWPDIPGPADFQGQRLHSARWDHRLR
jgi:hypothetical protein